MYTTPLPYIQDEFKYRITAGAVESFKTFMMHEVWNEFDYKLDGIGVIEGAHIKRIQERLAELYTFLFYFIYNILL